MFLEGVNNCGKLQIISGKFQNDAINDVKQNSIKITISMDIKHPNWFKKVIDVMM